MGLLIGDVIRHAAHVAPDDLAATLGEDELTFAEVDRRSNQVADALAFLDVGHQDRVAWWSETTLEAMPIFAGLAKMGAIFMPVNARLGATEAGEVVRYAKPRLLVVDAEHASLAAGWDVPTVTHSELAAAADVATSATSVHPGSKIATRTSSSSPAAALGGPKAWCFRTARASCGRSRTS